jgi:hypothetical protein
VALGMAALIAAQHGSIALAPPPQFGMPDGHGGIHIFTAEEIEERTRSDPGPPRYLQEWAASQRRVDALPSSSARARQKRWV